VRPDNHHNLLFLSTCSRISLSDFLLAKHNRCANLERDLRDLVLNLAENIALVELANILRDGPIQGGEVANLSTSPTNKVPPYGWHWIGRRRDLKSHEVFVLTAIKNFCPKDSNVTQAKCWQLMGWTKLSRAAVKRALRSLRRKGFIETKRTGRGDRIEVLEPPPELFCDGSNRAIRWLPQTHQIGLIEPSPVPDGSMGATLSVNHKSRLPVGPGSPNGNVGELGAGVALTHDVPRASEPSDRELEKLRLDAEILGRQERARKTSGLEIGQNPIVGPAKINPKALERIREREKQKARRAP